MLEAKALFYGGLLVNADECNYEDYAKLGIVCPVCQKAMFLVAASVREKHNRKKKDGTTTAVKGADIPAHWCHFADVDTADIERCEARAKQITPTERLKIVAQARGQRERILSRNLWMMLQASAKAPKADAAGDAEDHGRILLACLKRGAVVHEKRVEQFYANLIGALANQFASAAQIEHTINTIGPGIERWSQLITPDGPAPQHVKDLVAGWSSPIDNRMHIEIVSEVLRFICTSRQRPILTSLVESAIFSWVLAEASAVQGNMDVQQRQEEYNQFAYQIQNSAPEDVLQFMTQTLRPLIGMDQEMFEALFYFVRDDIAQYCAMVSWADQIAALQK
jgi:hypothetical protein